MFEPLGRKVARLALMSVIGLVVLPPEHVHLGEEDEHHAAAAVHRHFEPHHQTTGTAHVEHPEDEAHYLDPVVDVPAQAFLPGPDCDTETSTLDIPVALASRVLRGPDARVHGPPWTQSLTTRGPPASV